MSLYLDTRGAAVLAIGICDRCKMKRRLVDLLPDPNFSGLRVCSEGCRDDFDPYRLPARQPERVVVSYPRPDEPLTVPED